MGLLVEGVWKDHWYSTKESGGRFVRKGAQFRDHVTADGSSGFPAEAGRYHLYVSYACPWACRTLIFRALKGLEEAIGVSVVHPLMLGDGWTFGDDFAGATGDRLHGASFAHQVYTRARPDYTGRVTVPILWDSVTGTIVNNESSEIIRMLNSEFDAIGDASVDFYPESLRAEIDGVNDRVYGAVNNGVYRCGFATTQEAYDEAVVDLFDALDWLEERLSRQRYLVGDRITEADWRLFTTLIRFDPVYHGHFKCSRKRLVDYPNLWGHTRELYQVPGVAPTVHMDHIRWHYHYSHDSVNPHRIVPVLADTFDPTAPHGRDHLS